MAARRLRLDHVTPEKLGTQGGKPEEKEILVGAERSDRTNVHAQELGEGAAADARPGAAGSDPRPDRIRRGRRRSAPNRGPGQAVGVAASAARRRARAPRGVAGARGAGLGAPGAGPGLLRRRGWPLAQSSGVRRSGSRSDARGPEPAALHSLPARRRLDASRAALPLFRAPPLTPPAPASAPWVPGASLLARRRCRCPAWAWAWASTGGRRRSCGAGRHAMGNCCWTQCFGRLRREAGRLQRGAGGGG